MYAETDLHRYLSNPSILPQDFWTTKSAKNGGVSGERAGSPGKAPAIHFAGEHLEETLNAIRTSTSPLDMRLSASHDTFISERPPGADEDVHMIPSIVDHIIERCTAPGDLVFDPFAGFGTTIDRAVALGRKACGIELLPERVEYLQRRVPSAHIVEGDARELLRLTQSHAQVRRDKRFDLILTSPPFMTEDHHDADPLTAYEKDGGDYGRYLFELGLVAAQCARVVVPGGFVVWNVADIHHMGATTHFIRDCSRVLERHLTPVGRTEIEWDRYPHDLVADALLVFQREPLPASA